ncbi:MAG: hypothetical protein ACFFG0_33550 [Candidatus Thorarchaeota archaeon]
MDYIFRLMKLSNIKVPFVMKDIYNEIKKFNELSNFDKIIHEKTEIPISNELKNFNEEINHHSTIENQKNDKKFRNSNFDIIPEEITQQEMIIHEDPKKTMLPPSKAPQKYSEADIAYNNLPINNDIDENIYYPHFKHEINNNQKEDSKLANSQTVLTNIVNWVEDQADITNFDITPEEITQRDTIIHDDLKKTTLIPSKAPKKYSETDLAYNNLKIKNVIDENGYYLHFKHEINNNQKEDSELINNQIFLTDVINWVEDQSDTNLNGKITPVKNKPRRKPKKSNTLINNDEFNEKVKEFNHLHILRNRKKIKEYLENDENVLIKMPHIVPFQDSIDGKSNENRIEIGSLNLIVEQSKSTKNFTKVQSPKLKIIHDKKERNSSDLSRHYIRI